MPSVPPVVPPDVPPVVPPLVPVDVWRDPGRRDAERVEDLLGRLTLAERVAMVHQHAPAVPGLGLAAFRTGTEALHGVAWLGEATVFPQAVGLAATWDPDLLERVGTAVALEVRARHAQDPTVSLAVWAPVVNLLRDPRWGRNEEGYSEDPLLTARCAVAFCRGLRGPLPDRVRTAPTLKHFLAYNHETRRDVTSADVRPRVLHEYDLPPFRGALLAGVVDAVMPAYNLVNGRPNHVSPYLAQFLRVWSPHELLVVSDAEAPANLVETEHYLPDHPTAYAAALRAGVDSLTVGGADAAPTIAHLTAALERGLLREADVDQAVRRVLALRLRTGEFDPDGGPYGGIGADALHRPEHRALAREAARAQVVLLRNEDAALPLSPAGLRLAVVGPLADRLCTDWYSGTLPYAVTVADGLRAALAATGGDVVVADGVDRLALRDRATGALVTVDAATPSDGGEPALRCRDGVDPHDPAAGFDVFDWGDGVATLRAVATGRYVTVQDGDGALVADQDRPNGWLVHETFALVPVGGALALRSTLTGAFVQVDPASGALHAAAKDDAEAARFEPVVVQDGVAGAVAAARDADAVVVVVGNDPMVNGRETQDRTTLALPPGQDALVRAVAAAHPRVVLVVMSSYPFALGGTAGRVPAVVWTSHPGQEGGHGIADVLLGAHAPSGRLTQTWYRDDADLPDLLDYDVIAGRRTYQYAGREPLYPFGHGLTYTTFGYGTARVTRADETLSVSVPVTNTGGRAGVEVVQVYTRAVDPGPDRPRRRLQAFARVPLEPGETREVTLDVPLAGLTHWDVAEHALRVEPGRYEVLVGGSCDAIRATAAVHLEGTPAPPRRVVGTRLAAADFDDRARARLVDTTPEFGDAVEVDAAGWLLFRRADLGAGGPLALTATVARAEPGTARLELRLDDPVQGRRLGGVDVPSTGGRYAWTAVTAPVEVPGGVHDLYVLLVGALRLDHLTLSPIAHRR